MKDMFAPVDKAGRIVLPKKVRDELALNPGDLLSVSVHGAEVTLRPKKGAPGFTRKGRALVFSAGDGAILRQADVEQIINDDRERGLRSVTAGLRGRRKS